MKRFLAFVFGMFFGIFALIASLGIAGYVFVAKTPVDTYIPNSEGLGDFAQMSILDAYDEILRMLAEESIANPNADGKYFSVADFEEKYNADLSQVVGFALTDNVKEMPFFTLFTEDGVNKALNQTSIAGVLDIASSQGAQFSAELVAEMQNHTIAELLSDNPLAVLDNVPLKWVAAGFDNSDSQLMTALGNTPVGALASGAMGGNLLLAIKIEEKLSPLANIVLADVLSGAGEGDVDLVGNVLGDTTLGQIISDTGDFAINSVLVDLYVGTILNYERTQLDIADNLPSEVEGVLSNEGNFYKLDPNGNYYLAKMYCEETHGHTADCFDYVWTTGTEEVSKLYSVLANLKIEELAGGSFNITSLLDDVTLGDVMGDSIVGSPFEGLKDTVISQLPSEFENMTIGELLGDQINGTVLEGFADKTINQLVSSLNTAPIGKFLGYELTAEVDISLYQIKGNIANRGGIGAKKVGNTWHDAYKLCDHADFDECTSKCYTVWHDGTAWVEGLNSLLADKTVDEISKNGIADIVDELTLRDVMGESVKDNSILLALADTPIGSIGSKVNTLTLRQMLGDQVESNNVLKLLEGSTTQTLASDLNNLYLGQVLGYTRNSDNTDWNEQIVGATKAMANMKIGELNQETISNAINSLTLHEILGDEQIASSNVLRAIADKKIAEIPNAIATMKLGVVLDLNYRDDGYWYDNDTNTKSTPFNQKIANLSIGELHDDTIGAIVHELTMGELVESGFFEVHYGEQIDQDLLFRAQYDTTFTYTSGDWVNFTITELIDAIFGWEYTPGT